MTVPAISSSGSQTSRARRWMLLAFFLAAAVLFYFGNRAAYQGYFSGDDLDKLGWPTLIPSEAFYRQLVTPKLSADLFRPVGYLYYRFMGRTFHLTYWPYVAVLQAGHALNVILLFFLLRRLRFPDFEACVGALFYAFHAAVIDAYWQPQFIFEVLACMLCLMTLLLYTRGRWILGILFFWLAYKAKEISVTLPVVLLAFEMFLGERKWKRLIPYFLISLNFGVQALWNNLHVPLESGYVLRFTPQILWHTIAFYSSAIAFLPFAGFALFLLPVFFRDRRLYVGLVFMAALFVPMFVLPGRLESVYWYIPLAGLAIAVAVIAERTPRWAIALFFIVWIPINYGFLRERRRTLLAIGDDTRWYTTGLIEYARRVPPLKAVVYEGTPWNLGEWGIVGAIHHAFGFEVDAVWYMSPRAPQAMAEVPMAIVSYYPVPHIVKGMLRTRNELQSYIRFSDEIPKSQFGAGWYKGAGMRGLLGSPAEVTLYRPSESTQFEMIASAPAGSAAQITVFEAGQSLGALSLADPRHQTLRWKVSESASGNKQITIRAEQPGAGASHDLRIAVDAIGYVTP